MRHTLDTVRSTLSICFLGSMWLESETTNFNYLSLQHTFKIKCTVGLSLLLLVYLFLDLCLFSFFPLPPPLPLFFSTSSPCFLSPFSFSLILSLSSLLLPPPSFLPSSLASLLPTPTPLLRKGGLG